MEPMGPIQKAIWTIIAINYHRLIATSLPADPFDPSDWFTPIEEGT